MEGRGGGGGGGGRGGAYLWTEVDVLRHRAVGKGILEVVGIHTGAMGDHMNVM